MNQDLKFLLLNISTWVIWFFVIGYLVNLIPAHRLANDTFWTRLNDFEKDGKWYRKYLKINKWKDYLPELGGVFKQGFAKRNIDQSNQKQIQDFIVATRRAEIAHWLMTAGWIITIAFNPWWAIILNIIFAHLVNFPCLIVQRYNRARLLKIA